MAAGAGQRGTRQGGLRGSGECRLFSKAGVQRGRELGKKRGLTETPPQAVLVQAHLRQGLGSRAPGGTENPGVGPSAEPSPLPDPGEEGAPRLTSRYRTAGSACAGTPRRGPCSSTPSCRRQACQPPNWAPLDQVGLGLLRIPSQTAPHHHHTRQASRPPARCLTCLSRLASWSWASPAQTAASSSSSLGSRRSEGSSGRWRAAWREVDGEVEPLLPQQAAPPLCSRPIL